MERITRRLVCDNCDTIPFDLVTIREESGREYITAECLQGIIKQQHAWRARAEQGRKEVERQRAEFRRLHPDAKESEIEPHLNCWMCGTEDSQIEWMRVEPVE